MKARRLTPEQARAVRLLYDMECPERAIVRILKVPLTRVQRWRKEHGLPPSNATVMRYFDACKGGGRNKVVQRWEDEHREEIEAILRKCGL